MDADTVTDWILAGNAAAMDWWALAHDQPLPSQSIAERVFGADLGGISPSVGFSPRGITGTQILFLAVLALGAVFLFRR